MPSVKPWRWFRDLNLEYGTRLWGFVLSEREVLKQSCRPGRVPADGGHAHHHPWHRAGRLGPPREEVEHLLVSATVHHGPGASCSAVECRAGADTARSLQEILSDNMRGLMRFVAVARGSLTARAPLIIKWKQWI